MGRAGSEAGSEASEGSEAEDVGGGMGDMPRGNETSRGRGGGGGGGDGNGDGGGDGDGADGDGDHGEGGGEGVGLHADYAAVNVNIFIGLPYAGDTHPPHPPHPPITGEKRPQGGNPQGGNPQGNPQGGNPRGGNRRDDPHSEPHGARYVAYKYHIFQSIFNQCSV